MSESEKKHNTFEEIKEKINKFSEQKTFNRVCENKVKYYTYEGETETDTCNASMYFVEGECSISRCPYDKQDSKKYCSEHEKITGLDLVEDYDASDTEVSEEKTKQFDFDAMKVFKHKTKFNEDNKNQYHALIQEILNFLTTIRQQFFDVTQEKETLRIQLGSTTEENRNLNKTILNKIKDLEKKEHQLRNEKQQLHTSLSVLYDKQSKNYKIDDITRSGCLTVLGKMKLKPYQKSTILDYFQAIDDNSRRFLLAHPTGSGKTITSLIMAYCLVKTDKVDKIIYFGDGDRLSDQLATIDAPQDVYASCCVVDYEKVGLALTEKKEENQCAIEDNKTYVFIVDEWHNFFTTSLQNYENIIHNDSQILKKMYEAYLSNDSKHYFIYVTATPYGNTFDTNVFSTYWTKALNVSDSENYKKFISFKPWEQIFEHKLAIYDTTIGSNWSNAAWTSSTKKRIVVVVDKTKKNNNFDAHILKLENKVKEAFNMTGATIKKSNNEPNTTNFEHKSDNSLIILHKINSIQVLGETDTIIIDKSVSGTRSALTQALGRAIRLDSHTDATNAKINVIFIAHNTNVKSKRTKKWTSAQNKDKELSYYLQNNDVSA